MSVRAAAGMRAILFLLGLLQRVIGRQAQDFRDPCGCAWPSQRRGEADVYCAGRRFKKVRENSYPLKEAAHTYSFVVLYLQERGREQMMDNPMCVARLCAGPL